MGNLAKKIAQWLALDTEEGVTGIEYAVIAGLVFGGILVWFFEWTAAR